MNNTEDDYERALRLGSVTGFLKKYVFYGTDRRFVETTFSATTLTP